LRTCHLWRNIKYRKWNGFGHSDIKEPGPGSLALFCAACPQPNINLLVEWSEDPFKLVDPFMTYSLLADLRKMEVYAWFHAGQKLHSQAAENEGS